MARQSRAGISKNGLTRASDRFFVYAVVGVTLILLLRVTLLYVCLPMHEDIYLKIDELCRSCTKELTAEESAALLSQVLCHILEMMQGQRSLPGITFREATAARLKAAEHRRPHTRSNLNSFIGRFLRHASFTDAPLMSIRQEDCTSLLNEHFAHSPHVFRKAQSALHSIFSYAIRKGWCTSNPATGIDLPPVQERTLTPLKIPQIRALMRACASPRMRCMNAALRLMLWCGIRPTEVQGLPLGRHRPTGTLYLCGIPCQQDGRRTCNSAEGRCASAAGGTTRPRRAHCTAGLATAMDGAAPSSPPDAVASGYPPPHFRKHASQTLPQPPPSP